MAIIRKTLAQAKEEIKNNPQKYKDMIDKLNSMSDKDIDTSDIPEITDDMWLQTKVTLPGKKKKVGIRLDESLIDWFKNQTNGKGYQTLIQEVLTNYKKHHS